MFIVSDIMATTSSTMSNMNGDTTTTLFSTITSTSTRTLTRTLISASSFSSASTRYLPLSPSHNNHTYTNPPSTQASSLYLYRPSLPLSATFTLLFFLVTLHHGYLSIYLPKRPETLNKHRYTISLFIAALLSAIGYLTRCISIQKQNAANLPLYTTSTALTIIPPIFICATLYLLLARLITRCLPSTNTTSTTPRTPQATQNSPIPSQKFFLLTPRLLSTLFMTSDIFSFLLQLLGAVLTTTSTTHASYLLLTGLILQLTTFLIFLLTLHLFCLRVRNSPTSGFNPCILKVVTAAWIAAGFVLLRTFYRVVEFSAVLVSGWNTWVVKHEWGFFVFEAVPVLAALGVLGWWHPVKWIQERGLVDLGAGAGKGRDGGGSGQTVVLRKPVGGSAANKDGGLGAGAGAEAIGRGHFRRRSNIAGVFQ